mgnify:FL=1
MDYILKGHNFEDEVLSMLQLFFQNRVYSRKENLSDCTSEIIIVSEIDKDDCTAYIYKGNEVISEYSVKVVDDDIKSIKRYIKTSLYYCFKQVNDVKMSWGILTGIRPSKRIFSMWSDGFSDDEIKRVLSKDYLVSDSKIKLAFDVAYAEKEIMEKNDVNSIGIYIGIPFCPTRCLYCSFTSYSLEQYKNKVDLYLKALVKEFQYAEGYAKKYNIESIYIGGGTPTSLNEEQLEFLLSNVKKYFKKPIEFTVEAGRPDTITRDKLKILKKYDVDRISVNPQTMNQKTLELIGRKHTVDDFINVFKMAREEGHNNINTDLILGLPDEGKAEVYNTFEKIFELNPESVTVHTLAIKRASRLKETLDLYEMPDVEHMEEYLQISSDFAQNNGMHPYYMYRQKNMVGNFENVGYCKKGKECIYNIKIMEEKQTILALGAGGSTKIYVPETDCLDRIFNVKSVDDYINRIDEMIERKKGGLK